MKELLRKAKKTYLKLLKAETRGKTKKAQKKYQKLLRLNLRINKEKQERVA